MLGKDLLHKTEEENNNVVWAEIQEKPLLVFFFPLLFILKLYRSNDVTRVTCSRLQHLSVCFVSIYSHGNVCMFKSSIGSDVFSHNFYLCAVEKETVWLFFLRM